MNPETKIYTFLKEDGTGSKISGDVKVPGYNLDQGPK
jgi:hypothetical protein